MKTHQIEIRVSVAWWLKFYFYGVAFVSAVTGRDFDEDKASRMIDRALRVEVRK